MGLDVRLPIGLLFLAIGLLVVGYGLDPGHALSLGHNVNLWWGLVLIGFGGVMLALGRRGTSAMRPAQTTPEGQATEQREYRPGPGGGGCATGAAGSARPGV